MKKQKGHLIRSVEPGSIAEELGIQPGDRLISINGTAIEDVFDYRYLTDDEELTLLIY
ncbi:MAG: PDZ domain-containing protein, partial [Lachnospiraceae bacterium]|nr:PDZ domain-containing protein [Lachnospiraceae bacterium]